MKMLLSSKMSLENQIISYQETLRCDETERSLEAMMKRCLLGKIVSLIDNNHSQSSCADLMRNIRELCLPFTRRAYRCRMCVWPYQNISRSKG